MGGLACLAGATTFLATVWLGAGQRGLEWGPLYRLILADVLAGSAVLVGWVGLRVVAGPMLSPHRNRLRALLIGMGWAVGAYASLGAGAYFLRNAPVRDWLPGRTVTLALLIPAALLLSALLWTGIRRRHAARDFDAESELIRGFAPLAPALATTLAWRRRRRTAPDGRAR